MADDRKITIEILSDVTTSEKDDSKKPIGEKIEGTNSLILSAASDAVKTFARESFSTYSRMTDSYITQNLFDTLENGMSIMNNIIGGAIKGAKIGGAPGAVIGLAIGAAKTIVDTRLKYREAEIKLTETNIEIGFSSTRLGLIDGGRGTLN